MSKNKPALGKYKARNDGVVPAGTNHGDILIISRISHLDGDLNSWLCDGYNVTQQKKISSGIWDFQMVKYKPQSLKEFIKGV